MLSNLNFQLIWHPAFQMARMILLSCFSQPVWPLPCVWPTADGRRSGTASPGSGYKGLWLSSCCSLVQVFTLPVSHHRSRESRAVLWWEPCGPELSLVPAAQCQLGSGCFGCPAAPGRPRARNTLGTPPHPWPTCYRRIGGNRWLIRCLICLFIFRSPLHILDVNNLLYEMRIFSQIKKDINVKSKT